MTGIAVVASASEVFTGESVGEQRSQTSQPTRWMWPGILVLWAAAAASVLAGRNATWSLRLTQLDLIQALPPVYWVLLFLGTIVGLLTLWKAQTDSSVTACVGGIAFLYGPCFLLGLYPGIPGWDAYLHSAPAVSLLEGTGIPSTNHYAGQYPGPPTLLAVVAHALSVEPIVAQLIVTILAELALVFTFMGISRLFLDLKASAWASLAILAFTPVILTNEHHSPWLIGYLALWSIMMLLLLALRVRDGSWRWMMTAALLLGVAGTVSHPFLPVITVGLIFGLVVWAWRERIDRYRHLFALLGVLTMVYAVWTSQVAAYYFNIGLSFFRESTSAPQDAVSSWDQPPMMEGIRMATLSARALIGLRWAAYALPALLALIGVFSSQRKRVMLLLWLALMGASSVVIGLASASPWIQRLVYLSPPLLTLAAVVSVRAWESRLGARIPGGDRWRVLGTAVVGISLVLSLGLWHPPDLVYSVHPMQAAYVVWPQETAAAAYVARNASEDDTVGSDLGTMIVYSYFRPDYPPFEHGVSMGSHLKRRMSKVPTLFEGNWLIRSHRQEIVRYQAQNIDPEFWTSLDAQLSAVGDRVYDNGFVSVYHQRSGN